MKGYRRTSKARESKWEYKKEEHPGHLRIGSTDGVNYTPGQQREKETIGSTADRRDKGTKVKVKRSGCARKDFGT